MNIFEDDDQEPDPKLLESGIKLMRALVSGAKNDDLHHHSTALALCLDQYLRENVMNAQTAIVVLVDSSVKTVAALYWALLEEYYGTDSDAVKMRLAEFAVAINMLYSACSQDMLRQAGYQHEQRAAVANAETLIEENNE